MNYTYPTLLILIIFVAPVAIDEITTKDLNTVQQIKEKVDPFYIPKQGEYRFVEKSEPKLTGITKVDDNYIYQEITQETLYRANVYTECSVYNLRFGLPIRQLEPGDLERFNCTLICEVNNDNYSCINNGTHISIK